MADRNSPIGVFDSGVGGVSVLRACADLLPREDFLFFGDSANAPYGEKTLEQVRSMTVQRVDELLDRGVKAVVVACNTATSAAIALLRERHPQVPMIGIEPAVKPAAQADDSSQVIVMATPLTIHEEKYQTLAAAYRHEAGVISLPCRGLAELVEAGEREGPVIDSYLQELFLPFRHCNVEYIVLGCTHYPFVEGAIRKNFSGFTAAADPQAMHDELVRIFTEEDVRKIGQNARETIPLSWEKLIPMVLDRYQTVIDRYERTR